MDSVLDQIGEWLKELLVSGIMNQLTGLFDSVNTQVGDIATQVGTTPANFSTGVFAMIRNVSESVIIPVAGLILNFIACYELIQMIIDHNNLSYCIFFSHSYALASIFQISNWEPYTPDIAPELCHQQRQNHRPCKPRHRCFPTSCLPQIHIESAEIGAFG